MSQVAEAHARAGDFGRGAAIAAQAGRFWDSALEHVVMAQAESGDVDGARRLVQQHWEGGRRKYSLTQIALVQLSRGDENGALAAARELGSDSVDEVLSSMAAAEARAGDIKAARRIVLDIRSTGARDNALYEMAVAQAKAGDPKGGLRTGKAIQDAEMRTGIPFGVAEARLEAGDIQWASREANRLDMPDRLFLWADIAEECMKLGKRDEGADAFRTATLLALRHGHVDGDYLGRIAGAECRYGISPDALTAIQSLPDGAAKREAYDRLGRAYEDMGLYKDSLLAFQRGTDGGHSYSVARVKLECGDIQGAIETVRLQPNPSDISYSIAELAKEAARGGDYHSALSLASQVVIRKIYFEYDYRAEALREIARAEAKSGDIQGVLVWARKEDWPFGKASAYLGAAEGLLDRSEQKKDKKTN